MTSWRSRSLLAGILAIAISGTMVSSQLGTPRTASAGLTFSDHPRLFLTSSKLAELIARKNANTPEFVALKSFADSAVPSETTRTTLTVALGADAGQRTFTVADGSGFPTEEHIIRIDVEAMRVTRSGNTFTVVSRNHDIYGRGTSGPAGHPQGATVWKHVPMADVVNGAPAVGLLTQLGVSGYEDRCRSASNLLLYFFSAPAVYTSNESRWSGMNTALAHDWCYNSFTTQERAAYGGVLQSILKHYTVTNPAFNPIGTQVLKETAASGNIAAGYLRTILAMAATSYGDNPDAGSQWNAGMVWAGYLKSALLGGAVHGGFNAEGSEYSQTDWVLYTDVFEIIASATNSPSAVSDIAPWAARFVKAVIHATVPGSSNNVTTTKCSTTSGSTTLTCDSAATFVEGEDVFVSLTPGGNQVVNTPDLLVDTADRTLVDPPASVSVGPGDIGKSIWAGPAGSGAIWKFHIVGISGNKWKLQREIPSSYGSPPITTPASLIWSFGARGYSIYTNHYHTSIVGISGNTIIVRDPAPGDAKTLSLSHRPTFRAFGDVEQNYNYDDVPFTGGEPTIALAHAQDILIAEGDRTSAEHAEHLLQHVVPAHEKYQSTWWFLWRDTGIKPTDYTATLPLNFSTEDPDSFGLLFGRSAWSPMATWVSFIAGGSNGNHVQAYLGSFGVRRKGVYLTRDLTGYDIAPLSHGLYYNEFSGSRHIENPYTGARSHNTIQMNRHGSVSNHTDAPVDIGGASLVRSSVANGYLYGRMDASNMYRGDGMNWMSLGYPNNDARTWLRDFFYLNPDLVVVHDQTTYANATTSPTRWFFNTPCDPSLVAQTMTCSYSTQKLVQDIVLPSSAQINEVNYKVNEDGALEGYRTEVVSGVSASTEYGLNILQVMDSTDTPSKVQTLTTTNANVVEIAAGPRCPNGCVVGFVRGIAPTLGVSYNYASSNPDHYLMGFVPSQRYHVVEQKGTVTIGAATGSADDRVANSAGMLILRGVGGTSLPSALSPPSGLQIVPDGAR